MPSARAWLLNFDERAVPSVRCRQIVSHAAFASNATRGADHPSALDDVLPCWHASQSNTRDQRLHSHLYLLRRTEARSDFALLRLRHGQLLCVLASSSARRGCGVLTHCFSLHDRPLCSRWMSTCSAAIFAQSRVAEHLVRAQRQTSSAEPRPNTRQAAARLAAVAACARVKLRPMR